MKHSIHDVGGTVVKDNETYRLKDNTTLKNLILSSTTLWPSEATRGHQHEGQEEVYLFVSGKGMMTLRTPDGYEKNFTVFANDIVLIEDGVFHKVWNLSDSEPLYFVCVFDGKRNH